MSAWVHMYSWSIVLRWLFTDRQNGFIRLFSVVILWGRKTSMIGLCVPPMHQKKGPLGNKVNRSKRFTTVHGTPDSYNDRSGRGGVAWSMLLLQAYRRRHLWSVYIYIYIYSVVPWSWHGTHASNASLPVPRDGRHHVDGSEMHFRAFIGSCGRLRLSSTATTPSI